jgi:hypothetical protein
MITTALTSFAYNSCLWMRWRSTEQQESSRLLWTVRLTSAWTFIHCMKDTTASVNARQRALVVSLHEVSTRLTKALIRVLVSFNVAASSSFGVTRSTQ